MVFRYVFPLGLHCATANALKARNLRKFSLPFDYVFSNVPTLCGNLENDFGDFLNAEHFLPLGKKRCGHRLFNPQFFNHHNPAQNPHDYAHYERCISRARKILADRGNRKLFVVIVGRPEINLATLQRMTQNVHRALEKRTANFVLRAIGIRFESAERGIAARSTLHYPQSASLHSLVMLHCTGTTNGLIMRTPEDQVLLEDALFEADWSFDCFEKEALDAAISELDAAANSSGE